MRLDRRQFVKSALAAAVAGATTACATRSDRAPNLVLLVADDLRADVLGFAGDVRARTPHLDALAASGAHFRENFVTTSICATSRASIFTGQYASRHARWDFAVGLDAEQLASSYPARLRAAGYYTGFLGKWGVGGRRSAAAPEAVFDVWDGFYSQGRYWREHRGEDQHLTDSLAERAAAFLKGAPATRPFSLSVSFKAPHAQDEDETTDPFQPHPRFLALHRETEFPKAPTATEEHFARLPEFLRSSEARRRWHTRFSTPERTQDSLRKYYALVSGLDAAVGRILEALAASGRASDTVVLFTSDNGFLLGEHGLAGKWFGFEPSIRTPLVIAGPGVAAGLAVDEPTLNIDLAPTLLDLARLADSTRMQGRSLVPLWRSGGRVRDWRSDWFYEHRFSPSAEAQRLSGYAPIPRTEGVRNRRWKYLVHTGEASPNELLFDLASDPYEEHNAIEDAPAQVAGELRRRVSEYRRQVT